MLSEQKKAEAEAQKEKETNRFHVGEQFGIEDGEEHNNKLNISRDSEDKTQKEWTKEMRRTK